MNYVFCPTSTFLRHVLICYTSYDIYFQICDIPIDGKLVKLELWDTAGQERYESITTQYYRGSHAVIIVFDLSCRESFNSLKKWIPLVREHCSDEAYLILVGNKCDKTPHQISEAEVAVVIFPLIIVII